MLEVLDLVQARYGLTDRELFAVPYARLAQQARLAAEAEFRRWFRVAQITYPWASGKGETFRDYLERLEIVPKSKPLSPDEAAEEKRRALAAAEEISRQAKARRAERHARGRKGGG